MSKYVSLILIVIGSIFFTFFTFLILNFIDPISVSFINIDCYHTLLNLDEIKKNIVTMNIFNVIYFVFYLIVHFFLLKKILTIKKLKNILITASILTIFNSFIMFYLIDAKVEMKDSSIWWCEFERDGCKNAYKMMYNIDRNSTQHIPIKVMKSCFDDSEAYSKKALSLLKKRINKK